MPLNLVIGGELKAPGSSEFADPEKVHVVGVFPKREDAIRAWRAEAQRTVDNAMIRYFVVPLQLA